MQACSILSCEQTSTSPLWHLSRCSLRSLNFNLLLPTSFSCAVHMFIWGDSLFARITVCGVKGLSLCSLYSSCLAQLVHNRLFFLRSLYPVPSKVLPRYFVKRADLPNGCVCLQPAPDVANAIAALVEDPDPFDYIVIDGNCKLSAKIYQSIQFAICGVRRLRSLSSQTHS